VPPERLSLIHLMRTFAVISFRAIADTAEEDAQEVNKSALSRRETGGRIGAPIGAGRPISSPAIQCLEISVCYLIVGSRSRAVF